MPLPEPGRYRLSSVSSSTQTMSKSQLAQSRLSQSLSSLASDDQKIDPTTSCITEKELLQDSARLSPRSRLYSIDPLGLSERFRNHEIRAPVLGVSLLSLGIVDRALLSEADRGNSAVRNAQVEEEVLRGFRALLAQGDVVLNPPTLV